MAGDGDQGQPPPTSRVYGDVKQGKPRTFLQAPACNIPWHKNEDAQRMLFPEAYAVWAYASAFDAWDLAKPAFDDLKILRQQIESRGEFEPVYAADANAELDASLAADPQYCFNVYEAMLTGYCDHYGAAVARAAKRRMEKGKPVVFYIQNLSGLVGYYRLASHFKD